MDFICCELFWGSPAQGPLSPNRTAVDEAPHGFEAPVKPFAESELGQRDIQSDSGLVVFSKALLFGTAIERGGPNQHATE